MPEALQLCPNDHPPFIDICRGHARALTQLGFRVQTIFFASRAEQPAADVVYAARSRLPHVAARTPELIVSHRYRAYRAGAALARRLSVPRHVAIAHEFGMFSRLSRRLRYRLNHQAVCFAAVSEPVVADLRAAGVATPALLPNPLDQAALLRALQPRAAARATLRLPASAFVVGVLGRLHPKKAPDRALRLFQRHRQAHPTAHLVFVGDGPLRAELERRAGEGVTFAGFRADAKTLLNAFDVLLSCSTEREAFGLALLEGLAAGLPVIAADQPGPRFALGAAGIYFDRDEQLLDALRQHPARSPAHVAARHVQLFSPTALARRWGELLDAPGWQQPPGSVALS